MSSRPNEGGGGGGGGGGGSVNSTLEAEQKQDGVITLTPGTCKELTHALSIPALRSLSIRGCGLSWTDLSDVGMASNLSSLNLAGNQGIGDKGVAVLVAAVKWLSCLRHLDLSDCDVGDRGVAWLAGWMREDARSLTVLALGKNRIGPTGAARLADGITGCATLEDLFLNENPLLSCADLALAINQHGLVRLLDLSGCSLGPEAAGQWEGTCLEELRLTGNPLEGRGLAALGRLLVCNETLRKLDLRRVATGVNKKGTKFMELVRGLKLSPSLRHVDLRETVLPKGIVDELQATVTGPKVLLFETATTGGGVNSSDQLRAAHLMEKLKLSTTKGDAVAELVSKGPIKLPGTGILHAAINWANAPALCVQAMLAAVWVIQTELQRRDEKGRTPCALAIAKGQTSTVQVFAAARSSKTALCVAAHDGDLEDVRALLKARADPLTGKPSALFLSVFRGHTRIVQELLEHVPLIGGSKDAAFPKVLEVLSVAVRFGHWPIVRLVLQRYPVISTSNNMLVGLLQVGARESRTQCLRVLLEAGVDEIQGALVEVQTSPSTHTLLQGAPTLDFSMACAAIRNALARGAKHMDTVSALFADHRHRGVLDESSVAALEELSHVHLDLRNQFLDVLPLWLGQVRSIAVQPGNPLTTLPASLAQDEGSGVRQYLHEMRGDEGDALPHICVLAMGAKGCGKTHLLQMLSGRKYARSANTTALDVQHLQLCDSNCATAWYDFAGDPMFEPTNYTHFIAGKARTAVQVIVFDAADPLWVTRVHPYMSLCGVDADPIVVANHLQHAADPVQREKDILALFPGALFLWNLKKPPQELSAILVNAARQKGLLDKRFTWMQQQIYHWAQKFARATGLIRWEAFASSFFPGCNEVQLRESCRQLSAHGLLWFWDDPQDTLICPNLSWVQQLISHAILSAQGSARFPSCGELAKQWGVDDAGAVQRSLEVLHKCGVLVRQGGPAGEDFAIPWLVRARLPSAPTLLDGLPRRGLHERVYRYPNVHPMCALARAVTLLRLPAWVGPDGLTVITSNNKVVGATLGPWGTDGLVLSSPNLDFVQSLDASLSLRASDVQLVCPHCLEENLALRHCQLLGVYDQEALTLFSCGNTTSLSLSSTAPTLVASVRIYDPIVDRAELQERVIVPVKRLRRDDTVRRINTLCESVPEHENLVRLTGVVFAPILSLVLAGDMGMDLASVLRLAPPPKDRQSRVSIAVQLAAALKHLHSLNYVHGHIRPTCVYISGEVARLGMGFAEADDDFAADVAYQWRAPECMSSSSSNSTSTMGSSSDVFSYGLVVWLLLLGDSVLPYSCYFAPSCRRADVIHAVVVEHIRPMLAPHSLFPDPIVNQLHAMWDPVPEKRPLIDAVLESFKDLLETRGRGGESNRAAAKHVPVDPPRSPRDKPLPAPPIKGGGGGGGGTVVTPEATVGGGGESHFRRALVSPRRESDTNVASNVQIGKRSATTTTATDLGAPSSSPSINEGNKSPRGRLPPLNITRSSRSASGSAPDDQQRGQSRSRQPLSARSASKGKMRSPPMSPTGPLSPTTSLSPISSPRAGSPGNTTSHGTSPVESPRDDELATHGISTGLKKKMRDIASGLAKKAGVSGKALSAQSLGGTSAPGEKNHHHPWVYFYGNPSCRNFGWLVLNMIIRPAVAAHFEKHDAQREALVIGTPVGRDSLLHIYRAGAAALGTISDAAMQSQLELEQSQWGEERRREFYDCLRNDALHAIMVRAHSVADERGRWDEFWGKYLMYLELRDLHRLRGAPLGFGRPLHEVMAPHERVPRAIVVLCTLILRNGGAKSLKVFRTPVSAKEQLHFCAALEKEDGQPSSGLLGNHVVAADVLLQWVNQLPLKLLSPIQLGGGVSTIEEVLEVLPSAHSNLVVFIFSFLGFLLSFSDKNMLTSTLLIDMWGPALGINPAEASQVELLKKWLEASCGGSLPAICGKSSIGFSVKVGEGSVGRITDWDEKKQKYFVLLKSQQAGGSAIMEWMKSSRIVQWREWSPQPQVLCASPPLFENVLVAALIDPEHAPVDSLTQLYATRGKSIPLVEQSLQNGVMRQALILIDGDRELRAGMLTLTRAVCVLGLYWNREDTLEKLIFPFVADEMLEIESVSLLFRANSRGSRVISGFLGVAGSTLLQKALKQPIANVLAACNGQTSPRRTDYEFIAKQCETLLQSVFAAANDVPSCVKRVCAYAGTVAVSKFGAGENDATWLIGCGSVFFLRFLCPCLMGPVEHGLLTPVGPSGKGPWVPTQVQDVLIQMTSTIQSLASQQRYGESKPAFALNALFLDRFQEPLNEFLQSFKRVADEPHVPAPMPRLSQYEEACPSCLLTLCMLADRILVSNEERDK